MTDLSVTAASNSPAGSESPTNGDDFLRAIQAIVRRTNAKGSDIASATTTDIGAATAEFIDVTGTTTITGLGTIDAGIRRLVRFTGALTLTHNGTSLILPGAANITTVANDTALFRSLGVGNWICEAYKTADGRFFDQSLNNLTTVTAVSGDYVAIADVSDSNKVKKALISDITALATGTRPRNFSNLGLAVTMSANAATIALKGADGNDPSSSNRVNISYRNATITNGQSSTVATTSALSTVISSGSTGGTVSGVPSRIWVAAILVSGATELAWFNSVSGSLIAPINENGLISTTAEGGAGGADSAQVWYSTTARSNVPLVVLGYFDSTQATAGTWATSVTSINVNPSNRPGTVLQKLFAIKTDTQTHATTYTDVTGLSLSLTPSSACNKVAYNCNLNIGITGGGVAIAKAIRDSTDLFIGDAASSRLRASITVNTISSVAIQAGNIYGIDSPASTSALTYKVAWQGIGGNTVYINRTPTDTDSTSFMRTASTICVEEISV